MATEFRKSLFTGGLCALALVSLAAAASVSIQSSIRERRRPLPRVPTVTSEFIFTDAPFLECHASTLVELPDGDLVAAWFGGKREGDPSVAIWGARRTRGAWTRPEVWAQEPGVPCWNPVLFRDRHDRIWLFYKYGPSPRTWHGACRTSADGNHWSAATYFRDGPPNVEILGPIKNKPILLSNGDVLAGSSVETPTSWQCWVEISSDDCRTWRKYGPISAAGGAPGRATGPYGIIQPTVWEIAAGRLKVLTRSTGQIGAICAASSEDGGRTWTPAHPTSLPNPNSGIDAVKMKDGTLALVYNHTRSGRTPLNIAFSQDDGSTWSAPYGLEDEPGEYSYPAIIQTHDGLLHITYTWRRRRIKHVVIDPHDVARR